jgi:O-antigen/teichoic acid export membrane protein
MAPTLVQSLIPIVTLPIFTRVLSIADYGLWGIATAFGALVAGTAGLGLQVGYERNYFAAADADARGKLLYSVALFAAAAQVLALVLVLVLSPALAEKLLKAREHAPLLILAFLTSAVGALKMFFLTTLRNESRARAYAMFSVDELILGAAISLACVLWLRTGVIGLIIGPLAAAVAVTGALVVSFLRRVHFGTDRAQLVDTLRISLPLAPRALLGAVGAQIDRLILGAAGSLSGAGIYTIGQRMSQLVFSFMTALQNVYQPRVYRMLFAGADPRHLGEYLLPFAYASTAVAVGVIVFSKEIVWIVAAPEFSQAAVVLAILSVHYGLMFFGKQPQLAFARRTGLISVMSILSIALSSAGVYVGFRTGGAVGAAWGTLAAGAVAGAIGLIASTRFAPIHYPLGLTLSVFSALPLALLFTVAVDSVGLPVVLTIALKALFLAGFGALGWRAGFLATVWRSRSAQVEPSV